MKPSERFKQWLTQRLEAMHPGEFFPADAQLARQFNLSHRTVFAVMKEFANRGAIERIPGKGSCAARSTENFPSKPAGVLSTEESIAATIKRLIFNGSYKTGDPLPTRKSLSLQFKVAPATVTRAYRILQDRKLVVHIGRRYWIGDFKELVRPGLSADVHVFNCAPEGYGQLASNAEWGAALRKAERVLISQGYRVSFRRYPEFDESVRLWQRTGNCPHAVLFAGLSRKERYEDHIHIEEVLKRTFSKSSLARRPNAVCCGPSFYGFSVPWIKEFAANGPTAIARETARYLVRDNITLATFFFNEAAQGNRTFFNYVRLLPEFLRLEGSFVLRYVVKPPDGDTSKSHFIQRLHSHYPGTGWEYMKQCLGKYYPLAVERLMDSVTLTNDFSAYFDDRRANGAWLFSNDADAAAAIDGRRAHAAHPTAHPRIIGFENDPAHLPYNITTCVLDQETTGYKLAHALIGDIPLEMSRQGLVRMNAVMLERC